MPLRRVALLAGLAAVGLSACGSHTIPPAGRGRVDDPRSTHIDTVACLRGHGLTATAVTVSRLAAIQIGRPPHGPVVTFHSTPGIAQGLQITGHAQPAAVIGSALLYPNGADDKELTKVEACLAQGVTG